MADGAIPDLGYLLTLTPEQAVAYFRQKGYALTFDWHDMLDEAHARAFTVARVSSLDLLRDIRSALDTAIADGKTEQWFVKTLTPILQERGWWGKQELEVQPGLTREVQLGSAQRLELIFRQNTQSAYMAGRYVDFLKGVEARPYWQYIAVMDAKTRPAHAAMHGRVFRWDDPIWKTHWPPCGWNCRCRVRALSQREVDRLGLKVESSIGRLVDKQVTAGMDWTTGELIQTDVTGIKLIGADGKPITFFPDPGFNFNQAEAAWQPDLDAYPTDTAKQYVQGVVTGPEFERWFSIWQRVVEAEIDGKSANEARKAAAELSRDRSAMQSAFDQAGVDAPLASGAEYPVAVLNEQEQQALQTKSQTVLLSTGTLIEHLAAHPEVGLDAYQLVQKMIDEGSVYLQGDNRIVIFHVGDKVYRCGLKVDASRKRIYMTTLFETSEAKAAALVQGLTQVQ